MDHEGDRERRLPRRTVASSAGEAPEQMDAAHNEEHLGTGGGLHYQKARRRSGAQAPGTTSSRPTRGRTEPDQQQRAEEHPDPNADDEAWLEEQGYPKLGRNMHARVTQVEHGPYAGGTQQGRKPDR